MEIIKNKSLNTENLKAVEIEGLKAEVYLEKMLHPYFSSHLCTIRSTVTRISKVN